MSYQNHKKNVINNAVSFAEDLSKFFEYNSGNLGLILAGFSKNLNKNKNRKSFTFELSLSKNEKAILVKIKASKILSKNEKFIWLLE